ncbi:hypothetical protein PTKIN_Ptkin10aG0073300 [Pterospermum kingtungense]
MGSDFLDLHLANFVSKFNNGDLKLCNATFEGEGLKDLSSGVTRSLCYFSSILNEGEELAEPSIAMVEDGEARWKDAMMVQVLANQEYLAFAKMCVLVDAVKKIPVEIGVKLRGVRIQVRVEILRSDKDVGKDEDSSRPSNKNGSEGSRQQGLAGSEACFSILMEKENSQQPSSVAALMKTLKLQVQESVAIRKFEDKGKKIIGMADQTKVDDSVVGKQTTAMASVTGEVKSTSIQGILSKGNDSGSKPLMRDKGNCSVEQNFVGVSTPVQIAGNEVGLVVDKEGSLVVGETDHIAMQNLAEDGLSIDNEGELSSKRLALSISKLVKQPRLASLGVSNAIYVVKA